MFANQSHRGPLRVFDRPFWGDWVFWVFSAAVVASLGSSLARREVGEPFEPVSGAIDAVFSLAVNYVIWAVVPSMIRSRVRARKNLSNLEKSETTPVTDLENTSSALGVPPSIDARTTPGGTGRRLGRLSLRIAFAVIFLVAGLFLHGNWEYLRMLSTIEGGEAVLEGYNRETKVLLNLFDTKSATYSQSRATSAVTKWQEVASARNAELQPWLRKIESGGIAMWNDDTDFVRAFAEDHFVAWSRHLESESLDILYDTRQSTKVDIRNSFIALCTSLENFHSPFSWPSSSMDGTLSRVQDICDD